MLPLDNAAAALSPRIKCDMSTDLCEHVLVQYVNWIYQLIENIIIDRFDGN